MFIDPHVHCRDEEQSHKETIAHALKVAERAGFTAIFDMPNTKRTVTTLERVLERLELAKKAESPVFYGIYMALTSDENQIKHAIETYNQLDQVIGFKLYAGHSVGNIGITDEYEQMKIYRILAKEGYKGVVAVHCEKQSLISEAWNPENPITHAFARPWFAEIESVKDQLMWAAEAGFKGTVHIAHISVPEAVEIVNKKKTVKATCGVCPHHVLLDYYSMEKTNGIKLKMNPPLRSPQMRYQLFEMLKQDKITWIETDHAPHTWEEKISPPYMSGITGLQKYPKFIKYLFKKGFSEELLKDLTFNNIIKTFELDIKPRKCIPELNLENEYDFDPYSGFGPLA